MSHVSPPCGSLLVLTAAKRESERLASHISRIMPVLDGLAALEFGDWQRARALFETVLPRTKEKLADRLKLSFIYAQALLDWRFSASDPETSTHLREMEEIYLLKDGTGQGARVAPVLMLDYLLTTREQVKNPAESLHWKAALSQPEIRLVRRMIYGAISYLAEHEGAEAAAAFIRDLLTDDKGITRRGIPDYEVELLKGMVDHLKEKKRLSVANLTLPGIGGEYMFRAVSAVLLTQVPLDPDSGDWLYSVGEKSSGAFSTIGGAALYDIILYRVALHLRKGSIVEAKSAAEWGLGLGSLSLFPHYPRLCFLYAGLQTMDGKILAGREAAADRVGASTVASANEQALARLLGEKSNRNRIRARIRKRHEARFWYTWLSATERLGVEGVREGPKVIAWFKDATNVRSERLLVVALEEYLRRAAATHQ